MPESIIVRIVTYSCLMLALSTSHLPGQDDPGVAVIRSMHDRYAGTWYHTLVFDQRTTRRTASGSDTVEQWHEAARAPADLRIDQGAISDGNGALMRNDSTYIMDHGAVSKRRAGGNPILSFLFTVYLVPVDESAATWRALGYDLSKVHDDRWDGRPVTVVGADPGDTTTSQVWIDKERLVIVRKLGPLAPGAKKIWDLRFNKYQRAGGGWVSAECSFYSGGARAQLEEYYNIRADIPLDPGLFSPDQWSTAKHWSVQ
jgi:hypothetical protein